VLALFLIDPPPLEEVRHRIARRGVHQEEGYGGDQEEQQEGGGEAA
jgi:hypothetical protein